MMAPEEEFDYWNDKLDAAISELMDAEGWPAPLCAEVKRLSKIMDWIMDDL